MNTELLPSALSTISSRSHGIPVPFWVCRGLALVCRKAPSHGEQPACGVNPSKPVLGQCLGKGRRQSGCVMWHHCPQETGSAMQCFAEDSC